LKINRIPAHKIIIAPQNRKKPAKISLGGISQVQSKKIINIVIPANGTASEPGENYETP
jgi:hypothetical protein